MLVLDAALTGAKGVNLWSSFRGAPPQRKARLYTALVERGLASMVSGAPAADRASRSSTRCRSRRIEGVDSGRRSKRRRSRRSSACADAGSSLPR